MYMTSVVDKELYEYVKTLANEKFKSNTGIYRSSWIVREYKKRGGKYTGSKPKATGLLRWFKEKWINLYTGKQCGRTDMTEKYPLCRPTVRVSKQTPKTVDEIQEVIINKNKKIKNKNKRVAFK
jgi:hypothetical protein